MRMDNLRLPAPANRPRYQRHIRWWRRGEEPDSLWHTQHRTRQREGVIPETKAHRSPQPRLVFQPFGRHFARRMGRMRRPRAHLQMERWTPGEARRRKCAVIVYLG